MATSPLLYASDFPQKYWPGKFDILGKTVLCKKVVQKVSLITSESKMGDDKLIKIKLFFDVEIFLLFVKCIISYCDIVIGECGSDDDFEISCVYMLIS